MPDELSRSGVLEETQHVFNAALILRRAIQSLQPITPFPAEPADLSEEKIDVHVPSELYNVLSWIMTGKVQDMAPCLNKRVIIIIIIIFKGYPGRTQVLIEGVSIIWCVVHG